MYFSPPLVFFLLPTYLADVAAAVAHLGRARAVRRARRLEERVVLGVGVAAPGSDCS